MNRSLPLKGLAAAAVGALAVTGLALPPPAAHAAAPGVVLLSQLAPAPRATTRYDGLDEMVQLTAQRLHPAATIRFQYNRNPRAGNGASGWTTIGGSPTVTGDIVTLQWDGAGAVGRTVALRAVATRPGSQTYSLRNNVVVSRQSGAAHSLQIGPGYFPFVPPPPGSDFTETGFFEQPYADSGRTATTLAVTGTTTARGGSVQLSWWRPSDRSFRGVTAAAVEPGMLKAPDPGPSGFTSSPGGTFEGILDIRPFSPSTGEVLAVAARRDSDDVVPTTLYEQTITAVQAYQDGNPVRAGESSPVVVNVQDSDGQPIAGAEVRRQSDGTLVGYTDATGNVRTRQLGGSSETYYANVADSNPFTAGEDVASSVTIATYTPAPTDVQVRSGDGLVFDADEFRAGDLYVEVLDQYNRPFGEGTEVAYRIYPDTSTPPSTFQTAPANANARVVVPFDPSGPGGTFRVDARLASESPGAEQTLAFEVGDAQLRLTPAANPVVRGIGGQADFVGRLTLGSDPLPGRRVTLRFRRGLEVVPGGAPDAGILSGGRRVLTRTVTTAANGTFRFTVADAAERPRASEIGGRLLAATANRNATSSNPLDGNAAEQDSATVRFGDGRRGTARLLLTGADNGPRPDALTVTGPDSVAGEDARVYQVLPGGGRRLLATPVLNRAGDAPRVLVPDRNGRALTTYVVRLVPSARVVGSESAPRRVR